ncbi:MAG: lytic transglycosylase domain-containing protein [Tannerellaceae bacterium]|jgi:hypothetical protein|nr:lytic transglycosylase domain-containing protein [Tannerellaceae bacterium]
MYTPKSLNNKHLILVAILGLVTAIAFVSLGSNDSKTALEHEHETEQKRSSVHPFTVSPDIPSQISFCGQTIDLSRYDRHEGFDRELSSFTYLHSTTLLLFKRANRYFPIIEPILKKNGIPDDFKYLAVIESHLDPKASSPVRATGMWQFMEGTARQYGLIINATVDERSHVEKSTLAACKYLKAAYSKYGDWMTVASSYNAGMGRISGEQNHQNVESALDMWLVDETLRYPYRILAIKLIFEDPVKYGFILTPKNLYKPIRTKEISVSSDIPDLAEFAKSQNITYADLKRFNPWLKERKLIVAGNKYTIQIPEEEEMYY